MPSFLFLLFIGCDYVGIILVLFYVDFLEADYYVMYGVTAVFDFLDA